MKIFRYLSISLFLFSIISCSNVNNELKENFIKVSGKQFILDEKPYYFVGTNLWYGGYLGSPDKSGDRERLKKELDLLSELGINNLRVLAASELSKLGNSLRPAIQPKMGEYENNLLIGLDYLLVEMGKRKMHAVLFLNNYWEWSGGMGQYLTWIEDAETLDPSTAPWVKYNMFINSFYRNKEANNYFRKYLKTLITRKNSITGKFYYQDPAIMAWQLANEPRAGQGDDGEKHKNHFFKWVDETAGYIKSLDTNHLVTTGSEGTVGCLDNSEYFLKTHSSKNIDYATFHMWAKNWRWFDAMNVEETFPIAVSNAYKYIQKHVELANTLNKPITLEEFGLPRDKESFLLGTPTTARDNYFKAIFDTIYVKAKSGDAIAGTNFWSWGGYGKNENSDSKWKEGNPFIGDPPQEPQGLNSVFSSDASTLNIIRKHAIDMNSLRNN